MRALTVCQPYAELIARGVKPIENRTWPTPYRGELLIHAGKSQDWLDPDDIATYPDMAFGAVVAIVRMVACLRLDRPESWQQCHREYLLHHEDANGPWCWVLEDIRRLRSPITARGAQGLWIPTRELIDATQGALKP